MILKAVDFWLERLESLEQFERIDDNAAEARARYYDTGEPKRLKDEWQAPKDTLSLKARPRACTRRAVVTFDESGKVVGVRLLPD